jgi:hypothetical protein
MDTRSMSFHGRDGLRAVRLIIWPHNTEKKWDGAEAVPELQWAFCWKMCSCHTQKNARLSRILVLERATHSTTRTIWFRPRRSVFCAESPPTYALPIGSKPGLFGGGTGESDR